MRGKEALKAKPLILIDGQELDYPGYVTVSREFSSQDSKKAQPEVLQRLNRSLQSN